MEYEIQPQSMLALMVATDECGTVPYWMAQTHALFCNLGDQFSKVYGEASSWTFDVDTGEFLAWIDSLM